VNDWANNTMADDCLTVQLTVCVSLCAASAAIPFSHCLSSYATKLSTSKAVTDKPVSLWHRQWLVCPTAP